jgi:hypothetical protein
MEGQCLIEGYFCTRQSRREVFPLVWGAISLWQAALWRGILISGARIRLAILCRGILSEGQTFGGAVL